MVDARIRATTAALERAIIALSSEQPVSGLTVLQVTEAAGINRATFYRHADSPSSLLSDVLRRDLDAIRADDRERRRRHRIDTTVEVFPHSLSLVADHVERFFPIYRRTFADPANAEAGLVLTEHFSESCRIILGTFDAGVVPNIPTAITARFLGYALTGAVSAWVAEGSGLSRADFLVGADQLFPEWWRG